MRVDREGVRRLILNGAVLATRVQEEHHLIEMPPILLLRMIHAAFVDLFC